MPRVPFFIESAAAQKEPDSRICAKVQAHLERRGLAPLGYASGLDEIAAALDIVREDGGETALFVINTYGAHDLLPALDDILGPLPVLFFRRAMFAGRSGLMEQLVHVDGSCSSTTIFRKMTPRPVAMWPYGVKTANQIAERASGYILRYLAGADFLDIEKLVQREAAL